MDLPYEIISKNIPQFNKDLARRKIAEYVLDSHIRHAMLPHYAQKQLGGLGGIFKV